jgi:hypothetical protein
VLTTLQHANNLNRTQWQGHESYIYPGQGLNFSSESLCLPFDLRPARQTTMPAPLLLLTPLLSQTAFTTLALLEPISFQPFTDPSLSAAALRSWFAKFVWKGLYPVLVFGSVSTCVGGRAAWELGGWEGKGRFYVLGAAFSAAHFLFGPWVGAVPLSGMQALYPLWKEKVVNDAYGWGAD